MTETFPFSGAILDLDGLLLDTERWTVEAGPGVFAALGLDFPTELFESLVGVSDVDGAAVMSARAGRPIEVAFVEKAWTDAMSALTDMPLRPGVHAFLDALDAKGLPRAIATNSVTERARWKLQTAGLLSRVGPVVGRDQVAHGKPAPDVYVEAARQLGLNPADCAALDDSDVGVHAAVSAGIGIVVQVPDMSPAVAGLAHLKVASLDAARPVLGL